MSYIEINDIFDELRDENKRLFNELLSANNLIDILSEFKSFIDSIFNTFNTDSNNLNKYEELCHKIQEQVKRKTHKIISVSDDSDQYFIDSIGYTVSDQLNDNSLEFKLNVEEIKTEQRLDETIDRPFVCTYDGCGASFPRQATANYHMKTVHSNDQFVCPIDGCDKAYKTRTHLRRHTLSAHSVELPNPDFDPECDDPNKRSRHKKHICHFSGCKYKTSKARDLRIHIARHLRNRNHFCQHCNTALKSEYKLILHMKSDHDIDRPFACDHIGCESSFKNSYMLKQHQALHNKDLSFACDEPGCDKKFNTKHYLRRHVLQIHLQRNKYKCDWPGCEFSIGDPSQLNRHKRVHTRERRYACDVDQCGRRFMQKMSLNLHKAQVHKIGTIFKCQWPGCEYSTGVPHSMRTHESGHKTGGDYVCSWPECGKRMAYKTSLEEHINAIHKNIKPFSCRVAGCQYRTAFHRNIPQHMKTHRKK